MNTKSETSRKDDGSCTSLRQQQQQQQQEEGGGGPLGQRTTGRRFRRRQENKQREGVAPAAAPAASEEGSADVDGEIGVVTPNKETQEEIDDASTSIRQQPPQQQQRRKPRPEIELQIDAAIEARRKQRTALEASLDDVGRRHTGAAGSGDSAGDVGREDGIEEIEIMGNYEYLDHTADVQIHSWGDTFENALEELVAAMFGYMTRLSLVQSSDENRTKCGADQVSASGHDAESLVFAYLQEWLSLFHETGFVARHVKVVNFDRDSWTIQSIGEGEIFDPARHTQGTEVKAVTYSSLQIQIQSSDEEKEDDDEEGKHINSRCDIWVIVDI